MPFEKGDTVRVSLGKVKRLGTVDRVRVDGKLTIIVVLDAGSGAPYRRKRRVVRSQSLVEAVEVPAGPEVIT